MKKARDFVEGASHCFSPPDLAELDVSTCISQMVWKTHVLGQARCFIFLSGPPQDYLIDHVSIV